MDATFERDGRGLLCREADGAILSVTPWGEDALRVRAVPRGDPPDERHALLDPSDPGAVEVRVGKRRASIRCGRIEAVAEADAWSGTVRLEFRNGRGETLLREIASGGPLGLRAHAFDPLPGGDWAVTASFEGRDGERIRGMGQYQEERIDWKGCELELAHRNGQASVPFLMSSLGYGFLWHQPSPGTVAFGANRTVWRARRARALDYWIAAGDTPAELSLRYARATGFPPLPPDRALGFWQSKLRYASQGELLGIAREFRRRGLPLGVLVCDYCHWPRLGDFRFDPAFFPDPAAMARELDAMGVSLATSVWPLVPLGSPAHGRARREGLLARPARAGTVGHRFLEDASFLDPTGPRARRRLWGKFRAGYHDLGVRHFFLDLAEPEVPGFDASAFRFHAGPGARMGNLYPQHYARLFFEGQRAAGQEAVANLVRSAWAGSQRYGAVVWSGDVAGTWEDFRRQVCAGICIGAAGIPWWTTDIGGFHGGDPEDPGFRELLVRWFQWAAYCPVMRLHGNRLPNVRVLRPDGAEAAASGGPNEPWSFGGKALRIFAKYLRRREALRPYLRSLAREAHEFGRPLLRGMFYEFPDDPGCADLRDQHLLGARYLVAPVLEPGARSRRVALPASCRWRNVDTGEVHDGGRSVEAPAPLDTIPVFERLWTPLPAVNRSTTSLAAPPLIFAPAPGVTVPLLTDAQKAFLGRPRAERVAAMADVDARAALAAAGSWPRPVRLEWAPAPSWKGLHARYAVEVRRLPDGTPVFFAETAGTSVDVWNLEIARDYEWTVRPTVLGRSAAPAAAAFRTEDRAPRLLRVPGVPNVRDFGGRVGLGGRRVRQGLVFRSAGLNENAAEGFFAREEILARAADPAALLAQEKALLAEAERASALRRAGTAVWLPAPGDLREWTLYRPGEAAFAAGGEAALAAAEAAGTVPASFLGAPGRRVAADAAGRIELPGETMADNRGPAVFLLAFDADRDGFAKVGCGADWFWTLRCNGEVVADHADPDGNHRYPPSADNRVFPVPVRAGRNLLAAVVRAGGSGFVWCCAPRPDAPADKVLAAKAENCERRARYIFHVVSGRTAGASRISGENRALWLETFGVRTDLDLRSEAECWGMEESPLGRSVRWIQVSFAAYQGLQEDWGRAAFARVFPLFLDPASYPLDFHCIGGADRTGSLAFVLGALLGVDEEELWRDWEATAFWDANPDFAHAQRFSRLVASFDAFPGATIRERVESYVRSCGFTDADLETLRALLLD